MIKGTTSTGFQFEVDEKAADNMELVDALAEAADDDPLAFSKIGKMLLGSAQRKALYDHLRDPEGRVPIKAVSEAYGEIIKAFGKKGKN